MFQNHLLVHTRDFKSRSKKTEHEVQFIVVRSSIQLIRVIQDLPTNY